MYILANYRIEIIASRVLSTVQIMSFICSQQLPALIDQASLKSMHTSLSTESNRHLVHTSRKQISATSCIMHDVCVCASGWAQFCTHHIIANYCGHTKKE